MTSRVGSAYYVAPEVLKGNYDERCDVWSVGVIAFILLCGYPPFSGRTDVEILKKVRKGRYTFHGAAWNSVPCGAKRAVSKMLSIDPSARQSAAQALSMP